MWAKLKAFCLHSLTVAWSYAQIAAAALVLNFDDLLDQTAKALNDPGVVEQVKPMLPPRWVGYLVGAIGVITLLARLRSLMKKVG